MIIKQGFIQTTCRGHFGPRIPLVACPVGFTCNGNLISKEFIAFFSKLARPGPGGSIRFHHDSIIEVPSLDSLSGASRVIDPCGYPGLLKYPMLAHRISKETHPWSSSAVNEQGDATFGLGN
jgi:hypothetical protein